MPRNEQSAPVYGQKATSQNARSSKPCMETFINLTVSCKFLLIFVSLIYIYIYIYDYISVSLCFHEFYEGFNSVPQKETAATL